MFSKKHIAIPNTDWPISSPVKFPIFPGSLSYVNKPHSITDTNTNCSFLTDVFIYASLVWPLYSWTNQDAHIDMATFPFQVKKITVSDFSISNSRVFQVGGHLANTVMFCEFINNTTITVCTDQAHVAAHGRKPLLMYSARLSDCLQMLNLHRITNNITNANCVSNPTTSTKQNLQH